MNILLSFAKVKEPVRSAIRNTQRVVNVCTAICNVTDPGDVPVAMGIIPVWLYHKDNPNNKICVYALLDNASGGTFIKEDSLRGLVLKEVKPNFCSLLCMVPKKSILKR